MEINMGRGIGKKRAVIESLDLAMALKDLSPSGPAAGLSVAGSEGNRPRTPWIKLDKWSFTNETDWEMLCKMADADPNETESIKIYIDAIEVEEK